LPHIEPGEGDELFAAARAGDRGGFAALVRLHQGRVFSIALRMLMDRALAEDLAQEVFLQLHHSLRSIESHQHLVFWLRQVTARRAIDRLRQEHRGRLIPLDDSGPLLDSLVVRGVTGADAAEDALLHAHLRELIGQLAPMARAVLLLRYQEDLDPVEIARAVGIPLNTVKSHLKRSLNILRGRLVGLAPVDRGGRA
jgi:RNA polymerase sigma-70 factor (ECF subfamily)